MTSSVAKLVVRANARRDKAPVLLAMREELEELKGLLRLCQDVKAFPNFNSFECAITHVTDALVGAAAAARLPAVELDEEDLVSINYTSGTTARPKGVMMTHRNVHINAYNLIAHLGVRHDDVELWTLPMFHCNGPYQMEGATCGTGPAPLSGTVA